MNKELFERYIGTLPREGRVLDAGCGSGNNARYVHSLRPDLRITCLDLDGSVQGGIPDYARFVRGSVEDLSRFEDGSFDCVLCFHVLEHLPDGFRAVGEFRRVLADGGVVVAESPHWITTITPVGFNFYDDPTHVRPHNAESFRRLFAAFSVKYARWETAVYFHLDSLYGLDRRSAGFLLRRALNALGLYRTAVFLIAVK